MAPDIRLKLENLQPTNAVQDPRGGQCRRPTVRRGARAWRVDDQRGQCGAGSSLRRSSVRHSGHRRRNRDCAADQTATGCNPALWSSCRTTSGSCIVRPVALPEAAESMIRASRDRRRGLITIPLNYMRFSSGCWRWSDVRAGTTVRRRQRIPASDDRLDAAAMQLLSLVIAAIVKARSYRRAPLSGGGLSSQRTGSRPRDGSSWQRVTAEGTLMREDLEGTICHGDHRQARRCASRSPDDAEPIGGAGRHHACQPGDPQDRKGARMRSTLRCICRR